MLSLMEQGVSGRSILILIPQRTLAVAYDQALRTPGVIAGGMVTILTIGGLAQRMVNLFWPLIVESAGFTQANHPPIFLTLETTQYYMAQIVRPLLNQGYFSSITAEPNRIYSQIVDNLNKAAVVGFPYTEISSRLKAAWSGEPAQLRAYEDAQTCATLFREYCLAHNLLDFSLQIDVFRHHLLSNQLCHEYLISNYRHLIADNIEEDVPLTHDLIHDWLPELDSALLIFDNDGGFRRFLGSDPQSAHNLRTSCDETVEFFETLVASENINSFSIFLNQSINMPTSHIQGSLPALTQSARAIEYEYHRYYPQMLDWIAYRINVLIKEEGYAPGEIAVLSPFLSDALRFSLMDRLNRYNIPSRSHRPSRSLREEPAAICLLTLASLAHPDWGLVPTKFDVAYSLMQAIAGLDLVRAQMLTEIVYRIQDGMPELSAFDQLIPAAQERITFLFGERYDQLRRWILEYRLHPYPELDYFFSLIFGEILSQPGYGFYEHYDSGEVTANLIESVQKFRWVAGATLSESKVSLGREYIDLLQSGILAAQYLRSWQLQPEDAVLLAPAYTFLVNNRPVDVQFWLDIGSRGWFERLYQPLTHPYVLSRSWPADTLWTDADEVRADQEAMTNLLLGLLRRCRSKVIFGVSEYGEQGYEQRGPLLHALQRILRLMKGEY